MHIGGTALHQAVQMVLSKGRADQLGVNNEASFDRHGCCDGLQDILQSRGAVALSAS
jgi:hypothetical protein